MINYKYLIVETEGYDIISVKGCETDLLKAEKILSDLQSEIDKDDIIGYDDDYVQWEDNYGNIKSYQLISFEDCK